MKLPSLALLVVVAGAGAWTPARRINGRLSGKTPQSTACMDPVCMDPACDHPPRCIEIGCADETHDHSGRDCVEPLCADPLHAHGVRGCVDAECDDETHDHSARDCPTPETCADSAHAH